MFLALRSLAQHPEVVVGVDDDDDDDDEEKGEAREEDEAK
jgi:hypothetical protein